MTYGAGTSLRSQGNEKVYRHMNLAGTGNRIDQMPGMSADYASFTRDLVFTCYL